MLSLCIFLRDRTYLKDCVIFEIIRIKIQILDRSGKCLRSGAPCCLTSRYVVSCLRYSTSAIFCCSKTGRIEIFGAECMRFRHRTCIRQKCRLTYTLLLGTSQLYTVYSNIVFFRRKFFYLFGAFNEHFKRKFLFGSRYVPQ